ncbi:MAG: cell division protein FtsB [Chromatiales bacterium]
MRMVAVLLLALLLVVQRELWFGEGGLPAVFALQHQIDAQVAENAQLRERNLTLEAEVEDLKQGLEAIEERARSEMGMIKEGEIFFQIIDNAPVPITGNQLTADIE